MRRNKLLIILFFMFLNISIAISSEPFYEQELSIFKGENLTELKDGIKLDDIFKIESKILRDIALGLLDKTYPLCDRMRTYKCYLSPQILSKQMKCSGYSKFENPTGIYFEAGDSCVLWLEQTNDIPSYLVVADWADTDKNLVERSYLLKPGYNVIDIEHRGNSYIRYFSDIKLEDTSLSAHILTGKVNGFFDISTDDNTTWNRLLDGAVSPIMDIVGEKVQLAYPVKRLQEQTRGEGVELVQLYDSLIMIQHQMMGLVKYDRVPDNRMFGRVIWKGFMYADGIGAAFNDKTMVRLTNVRTLRSNCWGVAHEFGHVNQVRPNMKWVGTTEVTNNIYSVWSTYIMNKDYRKLEHEKLKDYDGAKVGGRITAFMESAFVHNQPWLTQAGNDKWDRQRERGWGGDHFVKLVPLWQLQLYFAVAGEGNPWGNKDFYGDIFIQAIDDDRVDSVLNGYYQLEFIKRACDVSGLDLTDFFEKVGMLVPIDLWVDDYKSAQMTITTDDIKKLKEYTSKHPKPSTPTLHYLTANSVDIYKKMVTLSGVTGRGYTKNNEILIVDNSQWQNVVAFETFIGDKLVKVAFVGAGDATVKTTTVHTPEGTTSVKAVGQDGAKIELF